MFLVEESALESQLHRINPWWESDSFPELFPRKGMLDRLLNQLQDKS